jgi:RNA polymerase sigma-70 factor, ECF subfamily
VWRPASDSLFEAFLQALPPELRARAEDDPELGTVLQRLADDAQQTHPELEIPNEAFAAHLGERVPEADAPLGPAVSALCTTDLYLALGCLRGLPFAFKSFTLTFQADIDRAAARCRSAGLSAAEFDALLKDKLFVDPPRIARYTGKGDLRGWLRVVLSHLVVDVLRRAAAGPTERATDPDDLLQVADAHDPELGLLRERYREPVREALERAFSRLTPRERNLLRLRLLEGWGFDQLGARFGVHRTSAARWIAQAQQTLFEETRHELHARFGIDPAEFASVARLVHSRLHLSVERILSRSLEPDSGA